MSELDLERGGGQLSSATLRSLGRFEHVQRQRAARAVRATRAKRLDELVDPQPTRLSRPVRLVGDLLAAVRGRSRRITSPPNAFASGSTSDPVVPYTTSPLRY